MHITVRWTKWSEREVVLRQLSRKSKNYSLPVNRQILVEKKKTQNKTKKNRIINTAAKHLASIGNWHWENILL